MPASSNFVTYAFNAPEWVAMDDIGCDSYGPIRFALHRIGAVPMSAFLAAKTVESVACVPLHTVATGYHSGMALTRGTLSWVPFCELEKLVAEGHGNEALLNAARIIQDIVHTLLCIIALPVGVLSPYAATQLLEHASVYNTKTYSANDILQQTKAKLDSTEALPKEKEALKALRRELLILKSKLDAKKETLKDLEAREVLPAGSFTLTAYSLERLIKKISEELAPKPEKPKKEKSSTPPPAPEPPKTEETKESRKERYKKAAKDFEKRNNPVKSAAELLQKLSEEYASTTSRLDAYSDVLSEAFRGKYDAVIETLKRKLEEIRLPTVEELTAKAAKDLGDRIRGLEMQKGKARENHESKLAAYKKRFNDLARQFPLELRERYKEGKLSKFEDDKQKALDALSEEERTVLLNIQARVTDDDVWYYINAMIQKDCIKADEEIPVLQAQRQKLINDAEKEIASLETRLKNLRARLKEGAAADEPSEPSSQETFDEHIREHILKRRIFFDEA